MVALFRIGKSAQNSLTLADVLKPCLEKRTFGMIVEATPEEWQKTQELDRKFADLFQVIRVQAPDQTIAVRMLAWQRARLEQAHECRFQAQAISALWDLRGQMAGDEVLPGAMVRVMSQLAARSAKRKIDRAAVHADYQASHKFREALFDPEIPLSDEDLWTFLDQRLIGQEGAKQCLADVIHVIKARLSDPQRPLAALLFIGPTGVGKTEAVKVLADFLFIDPAHLLRFDMNEYIDADAMARLIGDQQRPQGQLTTQVRQRRACVLLLDEIEKAHPQVHDLLLQVLGEGRLTDALGRTTDFSRCVIVMTSNLGASEAARSLGFAADSLQDQAQTYIQVVERFFRPEFLNRLDEQVVFQPLTLTQAVDLTRIQIRRLLVRDGFVRRTIFVNIARETLEHVAQIGFDPQLGGRALKRNIERSLTTLAADRLVEIAPEYPLLLEIRYENGQLLPRIQPLECESYRGINLSNSDLDPDVYLQLAQDLEALEARINTHIDKALAAERMELWLLKERLIDLSKIVADVCWDVREWQQGGSRTPFRLRKRARLNSSWRCLAPAKNNAWDRNMLNDWLECYSQAQELAGDALYRQLCLDRDFIDFALNVREQDKAGDFCITLETCVEHKGETEIDYLSQCYRQRLEDLDVNAIQTERVGGRVILQGVGYGVYELLREEAGLHLFHTQAGQALPLRVHISESTSDDSAGQAEFRIIRLYRLPSADQGLMVDLRTGLICNLSLNECDWHLLLFNRIRLCP